DLLAAQHNRADERDEDQYGDHFKRKQVGGEQRRSNLVRPGGDHRSFVGDEARAAEGDGVRPRKQALYDIAHQSEEGHQQRKTEILGARSYGFGVLRSGVEQHDDEDEEHHDGARVDDHLRGRDELTAQQQIEYGERHHHTDQRKRARNRL